MGQRFDSGGARIVQVDPEHRAINVLAAAAVKRSIPIDAELQLQRTPRQVTRLILLDSTGKQARCLRRWCRH